MTQIVCLLRKKSWHFDTMNSCKEEIIQSTSNTQGGEASVKNYLLQIQKRKSSPKQM